MAKQKSKIPDYNSAILHHPNDTFFPFVNFLDKTSAGKNFKKVSKESSKQFEDITPKHHFSFQILCPFMLAVAIVTAGSALSNTAIIHGWTLSFIEYWIPPYVSEKDPGHVAFWFALVFDAIAVLSFLVFIVTGIILLRTRQKGSSPQNKLDEELSLIAEDLPEWYYDIYPDENELYFISIKFMRLLIETTVDVAPYAKQQFLEKYQDKRISKLCGEDVKKLYK